jgi:peptidoglycan/xylan/chitin deacetylase (PgdA/CDA1 family)
MADGAVWQPLISELDRWRQSGRRAALWLRDDDAVEPTAALDRLLHATSRYSISATLAVIPAYAGEPLAARLTAEPRISVAVHGWAHDNYAQPSEKKQELGPHREAELVLGELSRAKAVIDRQFGGQAVPVLVPPWNRIDRRLLPSLGDIGFAALSVFGRARTAPISLVNTHIDIIDWHSGRGGKDRGTLVDELVRELQSRRETGSSEPVGVLTHHLVHDEAAWLFLEDLFEVTAKTPACGWVSLADLI